MKHSCLLEAQKMKKISNPPTSPFIKGGVKSVRNLQSRVTIPLFCKEGRGEITKK
jgi:hypothetical protein